MKYASLAVCVAIALSALAQEASAKPERLCAQIDYSTERDKLEKQLSRNGYTPEQKRFLLAGIDDRVKEIK